jgi:predicted metal-dependent phosphoesterase TrpH
VEAAAAAAQHGMRLISGVEISATWKEQLIHIVGLRIDPFNGVLQQGLQHLRENRIRRAEAMAGRLEKHGITGVLEGAQRYAQGPVFGRMHIARYLVDKGCVKDLQDAFKRYLRPGKPGYVKGEWATLEAAVAWIREAGGVAVIAHPMRYELTATKLRQLISDFKVCGGAGVEVVSGLSNVDEIRTMAHYAQRYDLLASLGSDYHGPGQTMCGLGAMPKLPEGVTPVWCDWDMQKNAVTDTADDISAVACL